MAEARVELERAMSRRPRLPVEILADEVGTPACQRCGKDVSTGLGRPWCAYCGSEQPLGKALAGILEALPRSLAEAWRMGQCAASQGVRNNPFVE